MDMHILWWYWLIFGMLLMLGELFIPSFTLFWFGLAALLLGGIMYVFPNLGLTAQLICWTAGSIVFTALWFKYFKPTMVDRTKAGISREAVTGQTGIVIRPPQDDIRGIVRFALPLLGADEWEFISTDACQIGDRVEVTDVSGNTLIVRQRP